MILDEQLIPLGLPIAQYQRTMFADHKVYVTVIFPTTKLTRQGPNLPMKISGVKSIDKAAAEHTAAIAAIRYLENATNTVIKDLNYSKLKLLEEDSSQQIKQLEAENRNLRIQLRKTQIKAEKVSRGWFLCVRYMCSFSTHLCNIAVFSYHGGMDGIHDGMKSDVSKRKFNSAPMCICSLC
jgi:hypothetical protein